MNLLSRMVVEYVSASMVGLLFHLHHRNLPPEPFERVLSLSAVSESLIETFKKITIDVLFGMIIERM